MPHWGIFEQGSQTLISKYQKITIIVCANVQCRGPQLARHEGANNILDYLRSRALILKPNKCVASSKKLRTTGLEDCFGLIKRARQKDFERHILDVYVAYT